MKGIPAILVLSKKFGWQMVMFGYRMDFAFDQDTESVRFTLVRKWMKTLTHRTGRPKQTAMMKRKTETLHHP